MHMTDSALLAHIAKQPHGKTGLKHLFKELRVKGDERAAIESALDRLAARGDLIELTNGHYAATSRSREYIPGRVSIHRDGYGFLIPDHPIPGVSGDLYIGRDSARRAMNGDRAIARITHTGPNGRTEGEIVKILRRAHPTVVGQFRIHRRGLFVVPHDERLTEWIEIPEDMAIPDASAAGDAQVDRIGPKPIGISDISQIDNMIVNAELLEYGDRKGPPVGRVIEVLGSPDDFGIDVEIIIRKHHLPNRFPATVIGEAQSVPMVITAGDLADRRDFRSLPIVTIDGE